MEIPYKIQSIMRRLLHAVLYLLYLSVFVGASLEIICRLGLVPNTRYAIHAELSQRKGAVNVLVLGDSFSVETPESASTLLRQYLAGRGVATLNLAGGGFGPRDYLYRLQSYGLHYSPRLILVNYYVGNDLTDTMFRDQAAGFLKQLASERLRESYFLGLLLDTRGLTIRLRRLRLAQKQLAKAPQLAGTQNPLLLAAARRYPNYITKNLLMEGEDAQRAWETNKAVLRRIFALGKRHNARILLTIFPSTTQVNESHFEFYRRLGFTLDKRSLTESKPQDLLNDLCRVEGWDCLDLLPVFRSEGRNSTLYLANDDHWDAEGNTLAFRTMAAEIDRRGLLK